MVVDKPKKPFKSDGPEILSGPDDLAIVEPARASVKRSTSTNKRPETLKSLFGSFRAKSRADPPETDSRRKSRSFAADDGRADANLVREKENIKYLRREARKVQRAGLGRDPSEPDGTSTDRPQTAGATTGDEDQEARRAERKAKRAAKDETAKDAREAENQAAEERRARREEKELLALEARKERARELQERREREEAEKDGKRQEDKRAKRAAREDRLGKEEENRKMTEQAAAARREERRTKRRETEMSGGIPVPSSGQEEVLPVRLKKSDRRKSHMDPSAGPVKERGVPTDDERRAARREARRPKADRRKSAPVDSYFDSRNGSGAKGGDPYMNGIHNTGTDHTSSWVNSQVMEQPVAEPEAIGVPPLTGDDSPVDEDVRRDRKREKRQSKYADELMGADDDDMKNRRREARRRERARERSDDESDEAYGRRREGRRVASGDYYGGGAARTFDGRPAIGDKRSSWMKVLGGKIPGL